MSLYFVVQLAITDEGQYKKYLEECDRIFEKYDGKYLAVDENYIVIEGSPKYKRIVIISFENEKDFNDWYYSDSYQSILKYRLAGSQSEAVLVHGK